MSLGEMSAQNHSQPEAGAWALPEVLKELEQEAGLDFVHDMIEAFETDTAVRLRTALTAAANGDRLCVRAQCHSMKGSSRQMGATALGRLWEGLEFLSSEMSIAEMKGSLEQAEAEFARVCRKMKSYPCEAGHRLAR